MFSIEKKALLPYTVEQMCALVNDIQHYPLFVPGCVNAHLCSQENNHHYTARLYLKKGPFSQAFTTRNHTKPWAEPPSKQGQIIEMSLIDGPFQHFESQWIFYTQSADPLAPTPQQPPSCAILFHMRFSFRSGLMQRIAGPLFSVMGEHILDAFIQRAHQIYG